jgi:hypothetical protein
MAKTTHGLAAAIAEIAATGQLGLLDALRGDVRPEQLLVREAGIGSRLARRVEEALGIVTLAELQVAAVDGRLGNVPGFGARRVQSVRRELAVRLGARARGRLVPPSRLRVPVDEMLDVDRQYRALVSGSRALASPAESAADAGPPPILHTSRGERHYTALFARTALAQALGKTTDWVVVYVEDRRGRRQAMIVTETIGPHAGHRVVRGREHESRERSRTGAGDNPGAQVVAPCEWGASRCLRRRRDALDAARRRSDRGPRSRGLRGPRRSPAPSPGAA